MLREAHNSGLGCGGCELCRQGIVVVQCVLDCGGNSSGETLCVWYVVVVCV